MADEDIKLRYWLVSSRPMLRRLGLVALLVIDGVIVALVVLGLVRYAAQTPAFNRLFADLAENRVHYGAVAQRLHPVLPVVSQSAVLTKGDNLYDFVAILKNTSTLWAVESVDVTFVLDDADIVTTTASFFPGEERYVVSFKHEVRDVAARPTASVRLANPRYRRVLLAQDLPPVRLKVEGAQYRILASTPKDQLSQVTATVTNEAVVAYPKVEVTALLYSGTSIVGAGQLTLDNVQGLETRPVDIRFYQALNVTNVLITSTVDVLTQT